jgi:hypothetical protein
MPFNLRQYGINIWLAIDMVLNAMTGGSPTETMSGRMGRAIVQGRKGFSGWLSRTICKGLNLLDKNHCIDTYEAERKLGLHRPESLDDQPGD